MTWFPQCSFIGLCVTALILSRVSRMPFFQFQISFSRALLYTILLSLCIQFCFHVHAGLPETSEFQKSYKCHCFSSKFQFSKNYRISQQGLLFQLGAGCLKFLILASWTNTKPQLGSPIPSAVKARSKKRRKRNKGEPDARS